MTRAQTRDHAKAEAAELLQALRDVLPLAEQYLFNAPSHPDNAKLETARDLIRKHDARAKRLQRIGAGKEMTVSAERARCVSVGQ